MDQLRTQGSALRRYLAVMQRGLWLIILGTVIAAAAAYAASRLSTPIYEASSTLLISEGQGAAGPDYNGVLMSERLARTYSQLLKGAPVYDGLRSQLKLDLSDSQMDRMITIEPVRDTQLIHVKVRHADAGLAAKIANVVPQVLIQQNVSQQTARLAGSKASLSREISTLQEQIDSTQRDLDREKAAQRPSSAEIDRLDTLLAQYRTTYAGLLQSYEQIRVAETTGTSSIVVAQAAKTPALPVLPRILLNTVLAAIAGMAVGVGSAFFFEYVDDTIKSPDDVQRTAHLPTLASVLFTARGGAKGEEPLVALRGKSPLAEGYRELRTNLQFMTKSDDQTSQVLMVTSSQPLEGKTTTLANLGVSLARIGKRVILIDADLRRPSLHRPFGLRNQVGLTTLLMKRKSDPTEALQETSIKDLRILTAGPIPANPAELLDSPETMAIIGELRAMADYVLIDTPPALSVTDSSILAQKVDGVILVTEMGRTRTEVFWHAVATLQRVRAPILGVVLNKMRARSGSYGFYYYGYGDEPAATKQQAPSLADRLSTVTGAAGSLSHKAGTPAQATTHSAKSDQQ